MKLSWEPQTVAFRDELRAWLDEHAPSTAEMDAEPALSSAHYPSWARAWQNRLFDAGLLIPGLGPEHGGRHLGAVEQLVYFEELIARNLPRSTNWQGISIIIPSMLEHGTPEQIAAFAMPALHAEQSWCLGMSEPDAGSDLAGLRTRAELHGDTFIVNGQKIWTSGAHHADMCILFCRTDPTVAKHKGISVLMVDMRSPGVEVRPLHELLARSSVESHDINEVFFTNVEVPAANLLGPLNGGWALTQSSLAHERAMLWIQQSFFVEDAVSQLVSLGRPQRVAGGDGADSGDGSRLGADPRFRDVAAARAIDAHAIRCMGYRGFAKFMAGKASPEHSILKLFSSEALQQSYLAGAEAIGAAAVEVDATEHAIHRGIERSWLSSYLMSFGGTIPGGTSEIQRNIIAERVLGLPRR
jgi:alkylation response protein AidB-like acyl-CoA dehydrogenase